MWSGTVFLALIVMVSGGVAKATKEDVKHGAGSPTKHGKQEHDVDGHHNVHFDHEAILGESELSGHVSPVVVHSTADRLWFESYTCLM